MTRARRRLVLALALAAAAAAAACDDEPPPGPTPQPLLPADYQAAYPVVRSCRTSLEHDLRFIVIRALAGTEQQYETGPFPRAAGTLIIKEEFSDRGCTDLLGWTLMQKQPEGYAPDYGDWRWQRLNAGQQIIQDGLVPRCASCHAASDCRARDFACAEP
jgi:hypothetical protein